MKTDMKVIYDGIDEVIANQKLRESTGGKDEAAAATDLLSVFRERFNEMGKPMSAQMERDVVLNFILAGRDTTASTLTFMFLVVANRPDILAKIMADVEQVDLNEDGTIPINGLGKLKYLKAVLMETLRLYPSVSLNIVGVENDDVLPCGVPVKAGTTILINFWRMGRDPAVWGPDAEEFNPDRFIGVHEPSPFKFPTFKAGPRMCLGKRLAMDEMLVVSHSLLRKYTFTFDGAVEGIKLENGLTLKASSKDTIVTITSRSDN